MGRREWGSRMIETVAIALVLSAPIATAQQSVPVGARVSVVVAESRRQADHRFSPGLSMRGEVTQVTAESLWIRPSHATGTVSMSKGGIVRMYRSRGAPNRLAGFAIEGAAGAVVGAVAGFLFHDTFNTTRGKAASQGAAITGAVGAITGAFWPVEYWRRVRLD
jgi:hypothetical protein